MAHNQKKTVEHDSILIRLSGTGDLLDVRFRVDEKMMMPGPAYIQDELSGKIATVTSVPKIGKLMTHRSRGGDFSFMLLRNPDEAIIVGSLVTLVIGDFRREHIVVQ